MFVRLTQAQNGQSVAFNISHIATLRAQANLTEITLNSRQKFLVREPLPIALEIMGKTASASFKPRPNPLFAALTDDDGLFAVNIAEITVIIPAGSGTVVHTTSAKHTVEESLDLIFDLVLHYYTVPNATSH